MGDYETPSFGQDERSLYVLEERALEELSVSTQTPSPEQSAEEVLSLDDLVEKHNRLGIKGLTDAEFYRLEQAAEDGEIEPSRLVGPAHAA